MGILRAACDEAPEPVPGRRRSRHRSPGLMRHVTRQALTDNVVITQAEKRAVLFPGTGWMGGLAWSAHRPWAPAGGCSAGPGHP